MKLYPDGWGEAAPLTGLLYYADCGGKMYVHRTNNGKRISQYTCSQYSKVPVGILCSTQHRINESAVLTLVSDMLRAIAEYSRNDRAEFIKAVQETQAEQQTSDITRKRKRLAAAQKRAGELEALRKKEERKDKLHQAYLRRKANGTQKRYGDKIRAKKKVEIESKRRKPLSMPRIWKKACLSQPAACQK